MLRHGVLVHGVYGPLAGPIQSTPRAELFAVCEALRLAVQPCKIHTDHYNILVGLANGKAWCIAPRRPNADLWKLLWFRLEDQGGLSENLQIRWCPGHSDDDLQEAAGNRWADALAKWGAAAHELAPEAIQEAKLLRKKLTAIVKWLGSAAAIAADKPLADRQPRGDRPDRSKEERRVLRELRRPSPHQQVGGGPTLRTHKTVRHGPGWKCQWCGVRARTQAAADRQTRHACRGPIAHRLPW